MSRGHLAVGAVIALLIGGVACEKILALDGTVTVAPAQACGVSLPEGACQACVASACCSQATTCAGDPGCARYESCLLGCGSDYACRFDCSAGRAGAVSGAVAPLDTCVAL